MWHLAVISKEQGVGVVVQSQGRNELLYQDFYWFKKSKSEFARLLLQHIDDNIKSVFNIDFNPDNSIKNISFNLNSSLSDLLSRTYKYSSWFYFFNVDTQEMLFYKGFKQCDQSFHTLNPKDEDDVYL
jgi:hypothetical protein